MYRSQLQAIFRLAGFPVASYGDPHFTLTPNIIGDLRARPYLAQWQVASANEWFHLRMEDHSLFMFDGREGHTSYSYLQCPLDLMTFREFLRRRGLDCNGRNMRDFQDEYGLVVETAELRSNVTPIRYDLDAAGYRPGVHPFAHMHIGLDNSIRLGLRRRMSPVSFCLFVMRHMYPESWVRLLERSARCRLPSLVRIALPLVEEEFWSDVDQIEAYLN